MPASVHAAAAPRLPAEGEEGLNVVVRQCWGLLAVAPPKDGGFDEGYLDEQFHQLEELQDDISPNFVEEVVTLFFRDSARLITNIEHALEKIPHDFIRLDRSLYQLKGSSSSIGAVRVRNECSKCREYCHQGNMEGCVISFQKMKREHAALRMKLEAYFQMLRQATPVGSAVAPQLR